MDTSDNSMSPLPQQGGDISHNSKSRRLQMISISVAALALGWAIISWSLDPSHSNASNLESETFEVFLKDSKGLPRVDVVVAWNHEKRGPDMFGMLVVPGSWNGRLVSIRERDTWAEIMTVKVIIPESGTATVIVPR